MEKVTAVILCYKRTNNLPAILAEISKHEFIDEILVWKQDERNDDKVYARYLLADQARNETIYTQDDDVIVHDIDKLYEAYDGKQLVYGAPADFEPKANGEYKMNNLALVGWGSFFQRGWLCRMDFYTEEYGEDDLFLREADRVFTMLQLTNHKYMPVELTMLSDATSTDALSQDAKHLEYRAEIIRRCNEIRKHY